MALLIPAYLFVYAAVLVVLAFWLYYDYRAGKWLSAIRRRRAAYHCIKCDQLYAAARDDQLHPCPRCGHANLRLKF